MAANPSFPPKWRAFDVNGEPLSGGLLYSYAAGTSTPQATYTTRAGDVPNANPVVLDANGEANVWTTPGIDYKFELRNSSGVVQWTVDNVPSQTGVELDDENTWSASQRFDDSIDVRQADATVPLIDLSNLADTTQRLLWEMGSSASAKSRAYMIADRFAMTQNALWNGANWVSDKTGTANIIEMDPATGLIFWTATAGSAGATLTFTSLKVTATTPTSTTSFTNTVTQSNTCKAWGYVTTNASGGATVLGGFNITGVACSGNDIVVTLGGDMTGNYAVVAMSFTNEIYALNSMSNGSFTLTAITHAGAAVNHSGLSRQVMFIVFGAQ